MHLLRVSYRFITTIAVFAIIVFPSTSQAIEWDLFNTDSVAVNSYLCSSYLVESFDAFCTDDGFMYMDEGVWGIYNDIQLPILDAIDFDQGRILVVMGEGTFSDGVYWYYPATHSFELNQFIYRPNSIHIHEDSGTYYIGYIGGLYSSSDAETWTLDDSLPEAPVLDMASFDEHLVVTVADVLPGVTHVYTKEFGQTEWNHATEGAPFISSLSFNENDGTLYGIYPDESRSSGLWVSENFGLDWEVVTYTINANVVYWQWGSLFVGWGENQEDNVLAVWDFALESFIQMPGENLPATTVNNMGVNDLIDCPNIILCTEDGAYLTCEIPTTYVDEDGYYPEEFEISAYPNPFNPSTNISVHLAEKCEIIVNVFNVNGRLVKTLVENSLDAGTHTVLFDGSGLTSGIYLIQLSTSEFTQVQKVVLLK
jgi:Secretion system C-terminal sorting domain